MIRFFLFFVRERVSFFLVFKSCMLLSSVPFTSTTCIFRAVLYANGFFFSYSFLSRFRDRRMHVCMYAGDLELIGGDILSMRITKKRSRCYCGSFMINTHTI